uniref:Neurogenic locus notch homolog protein 1-like n=1 Tax=Saccoglossus kowalevskii TaxID=10224 RepID=A0ABM0M639_SACKO|nr:PREDICTED: neurogenic locus notch homolog protein 1-like [Saccoglossus kowalevskii]
MAHHREGEAIRSILVQKAHVLTDGVILKVTTPNVAVHGDGTELSANIVTPGGVSMALAIRHHVIVMQGGVAITAVRVDLALVYMEYAPMIKMSAFVRMAGKEITAVESCSESACIHGTCDEETKKCDCRDGWSGYNCGTCGYGTCKHGECSLTGSYCRCYGPWSGERCDVCGISACINGDCDFGDYGSGIICTCHNGWTGQNCDVVAVGAENIELGQSSTELRESSMCMLILTVSLILAG